MSDRGGNLLAGLRERGGGPEKCLMLIRWSLVLYIALFPLGMSFREIGAVGTLAGLVGYYALDWNNSNFKRYAFNWAFLLFLMVLAFKTVDTIHFRASAYAFKTNFYKGPLLFLAGLESIRSLKDLRRMCWAMLVMSLYCGLDGIYQYYTKVDFFFGVPESGRLNAMWKTGRIGNLMSLVLPGAMCVPMLLPRRWSLWLRIGIGLGLVFPGVFLWAGAKARSGWLGLGAGLLLFVWMRYGARRVVPALAGLVGVAWFFKPHGLSPDVILNAPRWTIWRGGLEVWEEFPLLGAGVNCFEFAYKKIGVYFDPAVFDLPLPHPHNIYVQFLAETGVIGAVFILAFLAGSLMWGAWLLRRHSKSPSEAWFFAAALVAAHGGYLVTGFSAHNFFRTWWLGMAMTIMGLAAGACLLFEESRARK